MNTIGISGGLLGLFIKPEPKDIDKYIKKYNPENIILHILKNKTLNYIAPERETMNSLITQLTAKPDFAVIIKKDFEKNLNSLLYAENLRNLSEENMDKVLGAFKDDLILKFSIENHKKKYSNFDNIIIYNAYLSCVYEACLSHIQKKEDLDFTAVKKLFKTDLLNAEARKEIKKAIIEKINSFGFAKIGPDKYISKNELNAIKEAEVKSFILETLPQGTKYSLEDKLMVLKDIVNSKGIFQSDYAWGVIKLIIKESGTTLSHNDVHQIFQILVTAKYNKTLIKFAELPEVKELLSKEDSVVKEILKNSLFSYNQNGKNLFRDISSHLALPHALNFRLVSKEHRLGYDDNIKSVINNLKKAGFNTEKIKSLKDLKNFITANLLGLIEHCILNNNINFLNQISGIPNCNSLSESFIKIDFESLNIKNNMTSEMMLQIFRLCFTTKNHHLDDLIKNIFTSRDNLNFIELKKIISLLLNSDIQNNLDNIINYSILEPYIQFRGNLSSEEKKELWDLLGKAVDEGKWKKSGSLCGWLAPIKINP